MDLYFRKATVGSFAELSLCDIPFQSLLIIISTPNLASVMKYLNMKCQYQFYSLLIHAHILQVFKF